MPITSDRSSPCVACWKNARTISHTIPTPPWRGLCNASLNLPGLRSLKVGWPGGPHFPNRGAPSFAGFIAKGALRDASTAPRQCEAMPAGLGCHSERSFLFFNAKNLCIVRSAPHRKSPHLAIALVSPPTSYACIGAPRDLRFRFSTILPAKKLSGPPAGKRERQIVAKGKGDLLSYDT